MKTTPRGARAAAVLAILALAGVLATCSSSTPGAVPSATGPVPTVTVPLDLPVVISLAGRFDREALDAMDAQIAAFEAANPGILVEIVRAPRDAGERREWISSRLAAGDRTIDIYVLDAPWPLEFAARGDLVPLEDPMAAEGVDLDSFLDNAVRANMINGHLVALPLTADATLLYYRRDLLEKHGYGQPLTWDELKEIALSIQQQGDTTHGYLWQGTPEEDLTCNFLEQVWSLGASPVDETGSLVLDGPETQAALEKMKAFLETGASPVDTAQYDEVALLSAFRDGDALFMRNWFPVSDYVNSEDSPVAGKVGLGALPTSCSGGQSLGLSVHSLHPEEALHFMAHLVNSEAQARMAVAAGQPPVLRAAYQDANLVGQMPLLEILGPAFSAARVRPSLPEYAQISEVIAENINRMLANEQNIQSTADSIQAEIRSLLP
jgi:multiple sugar transport system substrate-binding protein